MHELMFQAGVKGMSERCYIIGASLSEPHIDELNVRNPYIYIWYVRTSPAVRHRHYTSVRDIDRLCDIFRLAA